MREKGGTAKREAPNSPTHCSREQRSGNWTKTLLQWICMVRTCFPCHLGNKATLLLPQFKEIFHYWWQHLGKYCVTGGKMTGCCRPILLPSHLSYPCPPT